MEELIRREAALEALAQIREALWEVDILSATVPEYIEHHRDVQKVMKRVDELRNKIEHMPTEVPNREWIPCEERLPEDGVEVWVTIRGSDIIIPEPGEFFQEAADRVMSMSRVRRGYWCEEENGWNGELGYPLAVQPIAWMPFDRPEPWGGD